MQIVAVGFCGFKGLVQHSSLLEWQTKGVAHGKISYDIQLFKNPNYCRGSNIRFFARGFVLLSYLAGD